MDSLTQATLGAVIGEAVLGKKLGNRALLWGALFGTLPDLDVVLNIFLDTARELALHRGGSHSILLMVFASVFLAKPLSKLWRKSKVTPTQAGMFVFLVWSTHVLIDCFTVYGTSVFWPFSEYRVAFNHLFIIDPLYTLPLLISLIWLACYREKKQLTKRRRILKWGLALSTSYVAFSLAMKFLVSAAFDNDLARRGIDYDRRMESPTAFNTLLWRSVADRENELWVGYRSVFEMPSTPIRWTIYPKHKGALESYEGEREVETLKWFSNGWWIARSHSKGVWMADLRFGESRVYDAKPGMVDSHYMFSWSFWPEDEKDRLRSSPPKLRGGKDALKRIGKRILGRNENWEGTPRLAGIAGSPPEWLKTMD